MKRLRRFYWYHGRDYSKGSQELKWALRDIGMWPSRNSYNIKGGITLYVI